MAVAMARVECYAREIVPSFNAFLYFRVGMPLAAWISSSLYDVRVDQERGFTALDVVEDASVVFVMNHRSNLDYGAVLRTLILRGLVLAGSDGYSPVPGREKLLTYYAN